MSPASDRQFELGEAQRAVILAELRTAGAASPSDLCDRLGLHSGTVQRHLARLLCAGVVHVARGVTSTGRRTAYAMTQAAADTAIAAIAATTPAHRRVPAPVVVPPPPPSETRVRLHVVAGFVAGYGDRHETCTRYEDCLVAHRGRAQAQCPDGARDERFGCYRAPGETERLERILAATAQVTFDPASLCPSPCGLATRRESRRE